ncbi:MAG: methyltransferase domain-containing protein [Anaerolineae bacterium]
MLHSAWAGLVQAGFRLLYTRFAWMYDAVASLVSLGEWPLWGRAALAHLGDGPVLEIGSGPGYLLAPLAERDRLAVGLDRSPDMARLAWPRRGAAYVTLGQSEALPFTTGAFATVVSVFPAPYIVEAATVDEVCRVLAPGGRLVVVDHAVLLGRDPYSRIVNLAYALTSSSLEASTLPVQLEARGFSVRRVAHEMRRARVNALVAEKSRQDSL